jgi:hypothetical protein
VSPDFVPEKATNALLRLFVGLKIKKLPSCLRRKHKLGRLRQQRSASYVETAVQEVGLGGEKNFGDKAIDR